MMFHHLMCKYVLLWLCEELASVGLRLTAGGDNEILFSQLYSTMFTLTMHSAHRECFGGQAVDLFYWTNQKPQARLGRKV